MQSISKISMKPCQYMPWYMLMWYNQTTQHWIFWNLCSITRVSIKFVIIHIAYLTKLLKDSHGCISQNNWCGAIQDGKHSFLMTSSLWPRCYQAVSYAHLTWYNLLLDSPHVQQQSVETFVAEEGAGDNVPSCLHYVLLS